MSRILVVDDCPSTLRLLERLLTAAGHQVYAFAVSSLSLHCLDQTAFDIAIVDYKMAAPDGLEVLRRIREVQPLCSRILTSGRLDLPVLLDAINRGEITRALPKPFTPAKVVQTVSEAAGVRRRLARALTQTSSRADEEEHEALRESLEEHTFHLALQPIVDCRTERTVAYEALLRNLHPGLAQPVSMLRAAERNGLLPQLAAAITERTVEILRRLPDNLRLFVNLHPAELVNLESLKLRISRLSPWSERLVFEITERTCLMELNGWEGSLQLLSDEGFAIALDDLGSGFNSLAMLAQLQPEVIKVDMSIIRGVDRSFRKQRLVQLLSRFARATGALLVAEGVETREESRALQQSDVDLLQGYLYGRPTQLDLGDAEAGSFAPSESRELCLQH